MILLSFDIEEFDMPIEYGVALPFKSQIAISQQGTEIVLALLKKHKVHATFFCTGNFAYHAGELIKQIAREGHEVASHGYYHSKFNAGHFKKSKNILEKISGNPIAGFRMPRMMPVDAKMLREAGYQYNSSLNPTYLPGRYNHLKARRDCWHEKNLLQVPASVTPFLRIPLFWLSFHNLPFGIYKRLCKRTYNKDGYLNLYFHPWEFIYLGPRGKFGFPRYIVRNSGDKMIKRMDNLIQWMKLSGYPFATFKDFIQSTI